LFALSAYLSDDIFALGFDPDCHYWNDGIEFRIETTPIISPIPPAALLFSTGIAVLAITPKRKKRKSLIKN
jgi:hypothetical protein